MKIDIEETKRVAELYGIEITPIDSEDNFYKGRVQSSPDKIGDALKVMSNRFQTLEDVNDKDDIKIIGIDLANGDDKTIHFKNGSSITPIDSENVRSKEKEIFISGINKICDCDDMILFLEEFCGIKLYWYQKVHLKLMWKLNKLGVIK